MAKYDKSYKTFFAELFLVRETQNTLVHLVIYENKWKQEADRRLGHSMGHEAGTVPFSIQLLPFWAQ